MPTLIVLSGVMAIVIGLSGIAATRHMEGTLHLLCVIFGFVIGWACGRGK